MKTVLFAILSSLLLITAHAQPAEPTLTFTNQIVTFTNLEGKVFQDAQILRADSKSVIVKTSDFYGNVPLTSISPSTQESLGLTADFMAKTRAFQQNREEAAAAALERTKAILAADQEKMKDPTNLLKMTVSAFIGGPVSSAYGEIYPCMVTLNGRPARVYVARLPVAEVTDHITQVNQLSNSIVRSKGRIAARAAKQRQNQAEKPGATAGGPAYVNSSTAQGNAGNATQPGADGDPSGVVEAQSLSNRQTQLAQLQSQDPVFSVILSGLAQGGMHVMVVVPFP
jgi:hypothetical protein